MKKLSKLSDKCFGRLISGFQQVPPSSMEGGSIFNTLSYRLVNSALPFLFISFGNHQLPDYIAIEDS
jgi:hypothetical protein